MREPARRKSWVRRVAALALASLATLGLFLVLPLMQSIGRQSAADLLLRRVDVAHLPPPPPPPPPQAQEDKAPPKPEVRPRLVEQAAPLDLAQLEVALNPGSGDGLFGDFTVQLASRIAGAQEEAGALDKIFSVADLDRKPRVVLQRMPVYPPELRRRKRRGTVTVIFGVDRKGRVVDPRVEKSTDPAFDRAALDAVSQWRFEPGTRGGEKVPFTMRAPITFNAE